MNEPNSSTVESKTCFSGPRMMTLDDLHGQLGVGHHTVGEASTTSGIQPEDPCSRLGRAGLKRSVRIFADLDM